MEVIFILKHIAKHFRLRESKIVIKNKWRWKIKVSLQNIYNKRVKLIGWGQFILSYLYSNYCRVSMNMCGPTKRTRFFYITIILFKLYGVPKSTRVPVIVIERRSLI